MSSEELLFSRDDIAGDLGGDFQGHVERNLTYILSKCGVSQPWHYWHFRLDNGLLVWDYRWGLTQALQDV
jgi:hypothetical protein